MVWCQLDAEPSDFLVIVSQVERSLCHVWQVHKTAFDH